MAQTCHMDTLDRIAQEEHLKTGLSTVLETEQKNR